MKSLSLYFFSIFFFIYLDYIFTVIKFTYHMIYSLKVYNFVALVTELCIYHYNQFLS